MAKNKASRVPFAAQTVLFHWMLSKLGVDSWESLPLDSLKAAERQAWENSPTPYLEVLCRHLQAEKYNHAGPAPVELRLDEETLSRLDARLVSLTERINERRERWIHWKYFQYFGLLASEYYLGRFAADRRALRRELDAYLVYFNKRVGVRLPRYYDPKTDTDVLSRLAFWQATGSGKTLLLHAHYYQYLRLVEEGSLKAPKHFLLITPTRGLAQQHVHELKLSGIEGTFFEKQGSLARSSRQICVMEITRFREREGPETIAPAYFEGPNLVFVDEGHRGSSRDDSSWRRYREQLAKDGFCIEYSATFAQAVETGDKDVLRENYARSVLIDYAYPRFYADGYGKHWRILNISEKNQSYNNDATRGSRRGLAQIHNLRGYLTGALTVLFQQLWVYRRHRKLAEHYHIARPFGIFVGANVTGGKARKESDRERTDIEAVLGFLANFVHPDERDENIRLLKALLAGDLGIQAPSEQDVFHPPTVFPLVRNVFEEDKAEDLYNAILKEVFNTTGVAQLHVYELQEAEGELALQVGAAEGLERVFGVVNVGDVVGLRKLCEKHERIIAQEKSLGRSLFGRINEDNSPLTMLVGSRKFTEGWSSWRVSMMGLLNLGQTRGTQIMQLFGRGVRLLGEERSLKRTTDQASRRLSDEEDRHAALRLLETLNIFGVRSTYMEIFQKELKKAGLKTESEQQIKNLPVVTMDPLPNLPLVRLPDQAKYASSGKYISLESKIKLDFITIDLRPRVNAVASEDEDVIGVETKEIVGIVDPLRWVDHERLYWDLIQARSERSWDNLGLPAEVQGVPLTRHLLEKTKLRWLIGSQRDLELCDLDARGLSSWQVIARDILIKYVDTFYRYHLNQYQTENSKLVNWEALTRDEQERFIPDEYQIIFERDVDDTYEREFVKWLNLIEKKMTNSAFDALDSQQGLISIWGERHLYKPLLGQHDGKYTLNIRTRPVALNRGEAKFVEDLHAWVEEKPDELTGANLYLLRNESRRGTGFFSVGGWYYPDFMLWGVKG